MQHLELAAAQHHLSTNANPFLSVKIVYNYGLWLILYCLPTIRPPAGPLKIINILYV